MLRAIAASQSDGAVTAEHVLPSQSQSASQRLAIYEHAYLARLQECLRESFPVLLATLGRETFDQFVDRDLTRSDAAGGNDLLERRQCVARRPCARVA